MEVAQIKVLLNSNFLYFIIKYPKPSVACKKIILPVQHNSTILNFAENNIISDWKLQRYPYNNVL